MCMVCGFCMLSLLLLILTQGITLYRLTTTELVVYDAVAAAGLVGLSSLNLRTETEAEVIAAGLSVRQRQQNGGPHSLLFGCRASAAKIDSVCALCHRSARFATPLSRACRRRRLLCYKYATIPRTHIQVYLSLLYNLCVFLFLLTKR